MDGSATAAANREALRRIRAADPVWTDVARAGDLFDGFSGFRLAHAGPPITWERMAPPQRGAAVASVLFEGWASTPAESIALLDSGAIGLAPNHDLGAVNPMAGVMSPSSAVFVVRESGSGLIAGTTLVEGANPCHRFGDFSPSSVERLRWLREVLAPVLGEAIRAAGGIHLLEIAEESILMGDDLHQRNTAATALLHKRLLPHIVRAAGPRHLVDIAGYLGDGNEQYFLNLGMAMAKAAMRTVEDIPNCSVVTAMARNGVELGIRVSGCGGRWFTGPAGVVRGVFFPGYHPDDANPDIGDSAITETYGLGYHALPGAPAAFERVGIRLFGEAVGCVDAMRRICVGDNPRFSLPFLSPPHLPLGIDVHKVAATGIAPGIATAIAHRGFGQGRMIGAGLVSAPLEPFRAASAALREAEAVIP